MQEKIGQVAGKIWRTLGEKGELTPAQLPKSVGEKSDVVSMALGWLARENKIVFTTKVSRSKQASCVVALTETEQQAFQAAQPKAESVTS